MTCLRSALGALLLLAGTAQITLAQTTTDAKADGKAFGSSVIDRAKGAATTTPDAARIPGFDRAATRNLESLANRPDRIEGEARTAAIGDPAIRAVEDSLRNRAKFSPEEIKTSLARSGAISKAPLDYTSGMSVSGEKGHCVPLPPGTGSVGTYMATCNTGYTAEQKIATCSVKLDARVTTLTDYLFYCPRHDPECSTFDLPTCRLSGSHPGRCLQGYKDENRFVCTEPDDPIAEYTCSAPVSGATPIRVTSRQSVTTSRNEKLCSPLAGDASCTLDADVCTDSDPVTRIVDGSSITQPCWAWQRSYSCSAKTPGSDCGELEANGSCRFVREDCLTDDSPCSTAERVYECPVPAGENAGQQYVCDGDIYCIDGSCETISREANDEFKDAVVALNTMDQARNQFDPATMTLFKGERETCSSKVFGVLNCCKGKGFPLIPGVQLLVALGCGREEILLHQRDEQGLCAYVGTYCSSSFLGVCLTKKKVYCCFESKLSRILQEQGRAQLPKPWSKPKSEQCPGFTLDEFARLDLSRMDFSEVYAEFTDAARLPDELQTSALIQQKIRDYAERSSQ